MLAHTPMMGEQRTNKFLATRPNMSDTEAVLRISYNPGRYEEQATYGPELAQYGQPAASTACYQQPPLYDARQLYSISPEQPAEDSGSAASSAN